MLKIGPYQLTTIETGRFALDGGAMFGIVPKTLWNRSNPADELNRIDMNLRALLIQTTGKKILIDCGMGLKWADKLSKIYKIDHEKWSLNKSLSDKGLRPEEITDVILTHLHFDHAGGLTRREDPSNPDSKLLPVFPNAEIYVQKRNWDLAWDPSEKDQASYLTENYSIYKDSKKLHLVETPSIEPSGITPFDEPTLDETELFPGVSVFVSHGHTLGMQIVKVSDGKSHLYYCADLIPTSSHVRIPWIMAYDCYPMYILKEKKKFLERAKNEGAYLFYEHCPLMHASKIGVDPKGNYEAIEPLDL